MAITIILIIAFWFLPLPVAIQILMTIFGSLSVLSRLIIAIRKASKETSKPHTPMDNQISSIVDRFISK